LAPISYTDRSAPGFVTFANKESVDEVQRNRPHRIDNTKVETKRATPREETGKGENIKRIFVGGLRDEIEDEDLEKYFSAFGRVISVEQVGSACRCNQ